MLDPNNSYDLKKSIEVGESLDENDFFWFEDPVPWNDLKSIEKIVRDNEGDLLSVSPLETFTKLTKIMKKDKSKIPIKTETTGIIIVFFSS